VLLYNFFNESINDMTFSTTEQGFVLEWADRWCHLRELIFDYFLGVRSVVSERLGHANASITLDTHSHVLPGLQEAAADKFDGIFEAIEIIKSDPSVSKMLAKSGELRCRPYRSRTCDTLIKSKVLTIAYMRKYNYAYQ